MLQDSGTQFILRNQLSDEQILNLYSNNVQCLADPLTSRVSDWVDGNAATQQELASPGYA